MPRDRKVTGYKFNITLPKAWRESHNIQPGQFLTPIFELKSPLILIPKGMELSPVENKIIELLTKYEKMREAQEIAESLVDLAAQV